MKEQTTETHKPAASPLTGARKRLSRIASGRGIGFGERIDLIVRIALMAVVAIGCFMVLQPFLTAILLAAVIAVVTWPLFRRLRASLRQSSGAAATLMVLLIVVGFLIPMSFLLVALAQQIPSWVTKTAAWLKDPTPVLQAVADIPYAGSWLHEQLALAIDPATFGHTVQRILDPLSSWIVNAAVNGKTVAEIRDLALRDFVISRISRGGGSPELADASTALHCGDRILLIAAPRDVEALVALLGREVDAEPMVHDKAMISRRILITKPELNGKTLSELRVRSTCGVTITRINRSGIDLVASGNLQLQIGDRVTVVGPELSVAHAERLFGNSLKRLNHPNLIPIFTGIALGVLLGSISFWIPGIPQPVKLGLAGGPLIVAILIGRYGPHYKLVTYTTMSANLMLREVGISLFLAGVGLGAGEEFVPTLAAGGYVWIAYGAVITVVPLLLAGIFGRFYYKLNYYTLIGVLSGASTNPPALAYSAEQTSSDAPSVGYATVYPLSMFLRVLAAQLLILIFG